MKKLMKVGAASLFAFVAAGCASVKYTSPGMLKGVTVKGSEDAASGQAVLIDTNGYYLLWTIPLATGDLRWNADKKSIEGGTSFFRDQVGVAELQNALLKIAETRNCNLAEVYYYDADASYAGVSYGGLIGALFGSSHMGVSAVLVPRKASK